MAERPLLVFPPPQSQKREKGSGGPGRLHLPALGRQRARLGPQFKELEKAFSSKAAQLQPSLVGASPEQVIVFETVGPVEDFVRNVKKIDGMDWLAEQVAELDPDDDFFEEKAPTKKNPKKSKSDKKLSGRLFLVMANQKALQQLLNFWKLYKKKDGEFAYGDGRWKQLFRHLQTVRTWNANDRLHPDVLEDWKHRVAEGAERVRVEVELWFRPNAAARTAAEARLTQLVTEEDGTVLTKVALEGIAYHAMLAELPIGAVQRFMDHPDAKLVQCNDIMFFRPASQVAVRMPAEIAGEMDLGSAASAASNEAPVVALLDGLPFAGHDALAGKLVIDDPDDWAASYPASSRAHGTAMASLILRGDMHASGAVLKGRVYVRPVLRPLTGTLNGEVDERMPADRLPVDLIHVAVRRMFEGEGGQPPTAPTVRIINFSVGDGSRLFDSQVSPLARLLDWLSVKYNVLFVVSAGNHIDKHPDYLTLDMPAAAYAAASPQEVELATVRALNNAAHNRRLLSPAEAINVLTVGALQSDLGPPNTNVGMRELVFSSGCPSPLNALGLGYGRSVKPDVLVPGGRAHYKPSLLGGASPQFSIVDAVSAPGCRVAAPGTPGSSKGYLNSCGTSNAAALATRQAALLLDVVRELKLADGSDAISDDSTPLLIRALMVHASRWGSAKQVIEDALKKGLTSHTLKQHLARFLGYGAIDPSVVAECTEQRATVISTSSIRADEGHLYTLPLPEDLSGPKVWRRLVVTLAWLSPINPETRAYRQAKLWIDPPRADLRVKRSEADNNMVTRGTVQHEVLYGEEASVYADGTNLSLVVNCLPETSTKASIPYALVTTLEVAAGQPIKVYEQIRDALQVIVPVAQPVAATP